MPRTSTRTHARVSRTDAVFLDKPARLSPALQHDLWRQYYATHSVAARQALLQCYIDLIRMVAMKMSTRLPGCVDVNDLIQEGYLGLDKAIDAFDPARGVQFSTFAGKRIWGAMMDGLRGEDWQRRTDRRRTQRLDTARRELATESGRPPTEEEVVDRLGISREEFQDLWQEARTRTVKSLWSGRGGTDGGMGGRGNEDLADSRDLMPVDNRCEDPARAAQRQDVLTLLVRGFTRAERLIVVLYYYEDLTMKEIGETLDISESRVSQMHSLIVQRIRAVMQGKRQELE